MRRIIFAVWLISQNFLLQLSACPSLPPQFSLVEMVPQLSRRLSLFPGQPALPTTPMSRPHLHTQTFRHLLQQGQGSTPSPFSFKSLSP